MKIAAVTEGVWCYAGTEHAQAAFLLWQRLGALGVTWRALVQARAHEAYPDAFTDRFPLDFGAPSVQPQQQKY